MKYKFSKNRIFLAVIVIVCCMTCFCACNKTEGQDEISVSERALYNQGISYDTQNGVATVVLGFEGEEKDIVEGVNAVWTSYPSYKINAWYDGSKAQFSVNSSSIYSAIDEIIPQEGLIHDGVEYNVLKVEIHYVTMYKSIESDARVVRSGNEYVHAFTLDKGNRQQVFTLTIKNPNTANWYATLIGCALLLVVLFEAVILIKKGVLWQKMKKR